VSVEVNGQNGDIRLSIENNASFNMAYIVMNALSAVIASYGLLADSSAVVIGAMIVAMLLGPLMGIALALVDGNNRLLEKALLAELGGAIIVFIISVIIGYIHQDIPLGRTILSRTAPNIIDLIIALAGGAAGAYATVSPRISASLVGVAISTALVPPLCTCGILLVRGDMHLAMGGFLLFFTNLVAIQFACSVVFALNGYHNITKLMEHSPKRLLLLHGPSLVLLIALTVYLGFNFSKTLAERRFEIDVKKVLEQQLQTKPGSFLAELRIEKEDDKTSVIAVVRTPYSIGPEQVSLIQSYIPAYKPPVELHIRSIITKEASKKGWLHLLPVESLPDSTEVSPVNPGSPHLDLGQSSNETSP
jgi:uncharacterized hydrophobic protein (TIGR00271 family)